MKRRFLLAGLIIGSVLTANADVIVRGKRVGTLQTGSHTYVQCRGWLKTCVRIETDSHELIKVNLPQENGTNVVILGSSFEIKNTEETLTDTKENTTTIIIRNR